jgi:pimeloyl-ACP methyl ester carboxylesterase
MTAIDEDAVRMPTYLRHNKLRLALHHLRGGDGRPLLLLHGLAERSPATVPDHLAAWPGPVWALDLSGHGHSDTAIGGGYFCEALMGDVDAALAHLGPVTVHGRGLGAYVGLLIAGARPELVRGTILADGPGLAGGSPTPPSPAITSVVGSPPPGGTPDPWAVHELARDIRPPDYAATFARQAAIRSGLDIAIVAVGLNRPPWLDAVVREPGVAESTLAEALRRFAAAPDRPPAE